MRMFTEVDGNGNGFLSLVEVQRAIRKKWGEQDARDLAKEVEHAFDVAKDSKAKKVESGDEFVDRREFRAMLVYLKRHFFSTLVASLGAVFEEDDQIDQSTFTHVLEQLSTWGVNLDPAAEFKTIDAQKPFEYRRTGERYPSL